MSIDLWPAIEGALKRVPIRGVWNAVCFGRGDMSKPKVPSHETAKHAARAAKLKLVNDKEPGSQRLKGGRGFIYRYRGRPVPSAATLQRIRSLVIPPAWTDVWICRSPQGHIQATGRDARG